MVSFPPVSPTRPYTPPSPHPYAPHAQPITFFSILSPAQYWARSTNHLAPRYAVSSITPLPHPSSVQIFSSTPCSQTPSASVKRLYLCKYIDIRICACFVNYSISTRSIKQTPNCISCFKLPQFRSVSFFPAMSSSRLVTTSPVTVEG